MEWIEAGWNRFKWDGVDVSGMEWVQVGWIGFEWDGMI
jgi:hypothetical protein